MRLNARRRMICIKTQHFNLNRILLLVIGLWPYQQSRLVRFQAIFVLAIMMTFVIFQLTTFFTAECTPEFVIKVLSSALFHVTLLIKYYAFYINVEIVKNSIEQIQHTCDELQDSDEIDIIKKYGNITKCYTTVLTLLGIIMVSIFIFIPIWPRIIDIFLPMNESRPLLTMQITEYFVDQETYFYLILLHSSIAISIGATIEIGTGAMLIGYYQHICAMFRIASYRIEQAMKIDIQQHVDLRKKIIIRMMKRIVHAVNIHREAMKSAEYLIYNFERSFFVLTALGVMCLSLNLFRIFQIVTFEDNADDIFANFLYLNSVSLYMFIANYIAQQITDYNNDVFMSVYNAPWYTTPLQIQKTVLFLLQRGNKAFNLKLGQLFVASLKSAATCASTSVSYFTVLYSTRH